MVRVRSANFAVSQNSAAAAKHGRLSRLTVAAVGVVYGDIGTSPLYTVREAFAPEGGLPVDQSAVLGILSLIFWALIVVVTLKYVVVMLRADNRGEGGVLALTMLAQRGLSHSGRAYGLTVLLASVGAALFYGDGVITPSISVLSAVEGLDVATPIFQPFIVPIALAILIGLFAVQRRGTARVGLLFGPVMCIWFMTIGILGAVEIAGNLSVLWAINPIHAIELFSRHGWTAFVALGSVVLAVTGAEALYADMGHFGRTPIRLAWLGLVLPSLLLNYFGQGALLIRQPSAASNPFYLLVPAWAHYPLILLATVATVIASQAVISGAFSLSRQAMHLGYLPRLRVLHTSTREIGQVYVPNINWLLMVLVVLVVIGFGSSSGLASAYGVAVTAVMAINTVLAFAVATRVWRWNRTVAVLLFGLFLAVDLGLFASTAVKIPTGGWFPVLVAGMVFMILSTWRRGRALVFERLYRNAPAVTSFCERLCDHPPVRVPGTSVFLTGSAGAVPLALLHNLKHNKVLHERVVIVKVVTEDVPRVPEADQLDIERLPSGFYRVIIHYGYMDHPDLPAALAGCADSCGEPFDMMDTSFFVSRERLIPSHDPGLSPWREHLFIILNNVSQDLTDYFAIPSNRVVELGTRLNI